jgi:hypothetical protein
MKIAALSMILSTSFLIGMYPREAIDVFNQLSIIEKEQRREKQAQDTRIERTENPLTRFATALAGHRKSYDGPDFTTDYGSSNTEYLKTHIHYPKHDEDKLKLKICIKATGAKKIAAIKAELDKITQQCKEQEKTIRPITSSPEMIADQFALATFNINANKLLLKIFVDFPSKPIRDHWSDYKTYIPYK